MPLKRDQLQAGDFPEPDPIKAMDFTWFVALKEILLWDQDSQFHQLSLRCVIDSSQSFNLCLHLYLDSVNKSTIHNFLPDVHWATAIADAHEPRKGWLGKGKTKSAATTPVKKNNRQLPKDAEPQWLKNRQNNCYNHGDDDL